MLSRARFDALHLFLTAYYVPGMVVAFGNKKKKKGSASCLQIVDLSEKCTL